eukprot:349850-Chlamydomonas_euryale.AAC.3
MLGLLPVTPTLTPRLWVHTHRLHSAHSLAALGTLIGCTGHTHRVQTHCRVRVTGRPGPNRVCVC